MVTTIGPFNLYELVGRGGMGSVYRAVDPIIGRSVAIKVIRLVGYNDAQEASFLKDRLFKEARSAGRLSHPGIVTIYQVGVQDDMAYIAMEYVDGPTLETRLASAGPLEVDLLSRTLVGTATALDYAHERAVIHRDIKPSNIMFTSGGTTKITDFGIAKTMLGRTTTSTGMLLGTPYYMSPEQVQGKHLDGRSDQFALAVIAYEILTRRRPFCAEQVTSICYQIVHAEPPSPVELNPQLTSGVSQVLARALAKDPADRFSTCLQFATTLISEYQMSLQSHEVSVSVGSEKPASAGAASPPISQENFLCVKPPRIPFFVVRFMRMTAVWAVVLMILIAGGVIFISRKASRNPMVVTGEHKHAILPQPEKMFVNKVAELPAPGTPVAALRSTGINRATTKQATVLLPPLSVPGIYSKPKPAEKITVAGAGRLVWTGQAGAGTLLVIENGHASAGTVIGHLPGIPVTISAFPAVLGPNGLTVFTTNPKYAVPVQERMALGEASLLWDPRHSTDLFVWEPPSPANHWAKIILHINSATLTSCLIEWIIKAKGNS